MRKIIFLDFDGPLTNRRTYYAYDRPKNRQMWTTADPVMINYLNHVCKNLKAEVVISSTWRLTSLTPTKLSAKSSLISWGFTGTFHEDFATPYSKDGSRGKEIEGWLLDHPDTVHFCSIDDCVLEEHLNPVYADPEDGVSSSEMKKMRYLLGDSAPKQEGYIRYNYNDFLKAVGNDRVRDS